jgi:lincosamide and streptogramin A transport system ATP-binding/permease protein
MSKIIINDLSFSYKEYYQPIFSKVNLSIDTNWKLGLIGRNGRGKTTLLRLLHGEIEPDRGTIMKDVTTELFPYPVNMNFRNTLDVVKESIGKLKSMENRMEEILADIDGEGSSKDTKMEEYQSILADYLELDGFSIESRIKKELNLMQLPERLLTQDYELLSGGEKTKLQIIALFLRKNAFVLLDEPTNHLDLEGKQVLSAYLQNKSGFLIVSHDRAFIDEIVDHVLSINKANITLEKGNYTSWKMNKEMTEEYEFRTRARLEREVDALEKVSERTRSWASVAEKEKNPLKTHNRGNGTRAAKFMRQAKTAEQNIQNNLIEKKNLLKNYEVTVDLILKQQETRAPILVSGYDVSFGYTEEPLFEKLTFCINKGDRVWIRGNNGKGKSTLLKLISRRIPCNRLIFAEGVVMETAFQEPLWTEGYVNELIKDVEMRSRFLDICHRLDVNYDVLKRPLETFSSGEQKKIDIARALASPSQLLLLDEPLNFMDIYFREQLEKAILKYTPTIVFIEHDEQFGRNVATSIINL